MMTLLPVYSFSLAGMYFRPEQEASNRSSKAAAARQADEGLEGTAGIKTVDLE
jgi:hypothetical protein